MKQRLVVFLTLFLVLMVGSSAAATGKRRDRTKPTVTVTSPADGATVAGTVTVSADAADNVAVDHVTFEVDGTTVSSDSSSPYSFSWDTSTVGDGVHRVSARAADTSGNVSADSAVSVTVQNGTHPPPTSGSYFGTSASGEAQSRMGPSVPTGLPRDAATCAASIIRNSKEARPDNTTANHTVGDGNYTLGPWAIDPYWSARAANMQRVQGQFTGTTTEMFSWAACRWGIDEDTLRAVAVQESYWHISTVGDYCGVVGEGSYGLMQIKNATCNGQLGWGGYPDSTQSSAFDVDFYGAYLRSCYDGDFYDGGSYLYGRQTVTQIAAAHGWNYVLWGCVGSWFSGGWYDSGAQSYISGVKAHLANRDWEKF